MNYQEAMQALYDNKKVRLEEWPDGYYWTETELYSCRYETSGGDELTLDVTLSFANNKADWELFGEDQETGDDPVADLEKRIAALEARL